MKEENKDLMRCLDCFYEGERKEFYSIDETVGKQLYEKYECPECGSSEVESVELEGK